MSDSRPHETVKPDRGENTGETPPESTPKAGDAATSGSVAGQWAEAARDSLYSVYESALKATGIVPVKPAEVPETINFADKPILPVEKAVAPAADTRPATSGSGLLGNLKSFSEFLYSGSKAVTDLFESGDRGDPFKKAEEAGKSDLSGLFAGAKILTNIGMDGARILTNIGFDVADSLVSSAFYSSKDTGPPGTDSKTDKGSSIVGDAVKRIEDLLGIKSDKPADPATRSLDLQTPENGRLHVDATKTGIHVESETHGTFDRSKGKGPQDLSVQTTDGRHFRQGKEGEREASSDRSDLKVEQKGEKVIIKDKNGNQVAEFGSAGDAQRFLDNGEISFARPGESVEQAAERIKAEQGERWDNNNHIITDGKGNVLTVDENGNSLRRYPNGTIEMHYKREGEDGQTGHVDVRLSRRNGRTVVSIKSEDGEFHETDEMTSRQVREHLAGSDLSWDNERLNHRRHRRHAPGANDPATSESVRAPGSGERPATSSAPEAPVPVMDDQGRLQVSPSTTIDAATGEVEVKQGENVITVRANPDTGQVVLSESESGRTMTQDQQGRLVVQGRDEADRISFDPTTRVLDAFGIEMSDNGSRIRNEDGSFTRIDRSGNFELFDRNNNSLLKAFDNNVSAYDGSEIDDDSFYEAIAEAIEQQERIEAEHEARAAAYSAMAFADSVGSGGAGVISEGAVAAKISGILDAIAHCAAHGVAPPGELYVALARLQNAKPEADHQIHLQNKLVSELGQVNNALIGYALRSGSNDPATAIAYARRQWFGSEATTA